MHLLQFIFLFFAFGILGCAPTSTLPQSPIDFEYQMQGERYQLSQLRNTPVLLTFVRTSEVTSEMQLDEIQKVVEKVQGRVAVLVLTLAPNEQPMLKMFVEFHNYPFFIGIADWSVASGQSVLGKIPIVPTTYLLSENGEVLEMFPGATNSIKILENVRRYKFTS